MGGEKHGAGLPRSISSLGLLFLCLTFPIVAKGVRSDSSSSDFKPVDSILLDCGSPQPTKLDDGRTFKSDGDFGSYLETGEDISVSVPSLPQNVTEFETTTPLLLTAKVFNEASTYKFIIRKEGRHWLRLYFFPVPHPEYNLTAAKFTVQTDKFVLLRGFSAPNATAVVFKEYLIDLSPDEGFLIKFIPEKNLAFINAIELISVPDMLISDTATSVFPKDVQFQGMKDYALEVVHRLNVGGELIVPKGDTLGRTWLPDADYLVNINAAKNVSVNPRVVKYNNESMSFSAPTAVYSSANTMAESNTETPNFNLSWKLFVEVDYSYYIRMHFCDIISKMMDNLYFSIYINGILSEPRLDLSSVTGGLAVPYYKDFMLNVTKVTSNGILVQLGPVRGDSSGEAQAILNGLEIMKMSNQYGSLNGTFDVNGVDHGPSGSHLMKIIAGVGLAMAAMAMLLLGMNFTRWQKRPPDWEKRNSFSSWLLPLHAGHSTFMSSRSGSRYGSKSKSGYSGFFSSALGLGRVFSFAELQDATRNFDEKAVIGVGGFGKVYLGELEDGTQLAIKRANASSEQGINEFQTEIQMLSKLRHRHLVSLIGYCDEQSEMILVYEYMSNGPFRDHLYGSNLPPLTWKQRLEICIGSARGLHYLHTGTAQGIIHRDVKTTNILLDEKLVSKVADFGLSKDAPSMEQTHVSTAVKGSFGYLDPEYFRRQQLTEKSDVYSFGVVLFEALCARPAINPALPREQVSLAEWALQWHRKGMIEKIIDPHLGATINPGSLKKFVEAAEKCLAEYGVDRPSMGDVLWNLEYALQLQEASLTAEDKSGNLVSAEFPDANEAGVNNDDTDVTLGSPAAFLSGVDGR